MKYLDEIKIITDRYKKKGIPKGTKGVIISSEIRGKNFLCELSNVPDFYEVSSICFEDLIVTKSSNIEDQVILNDLPLNDPHWWCKVEDGYILNLLGERKNKIPYDYDS